MNSRRKHWVIRLFTLCAAAIVIVAVTIPASAEPPLVGLAGDKYRMAYVGVIEGLGGESEQTSGAELEDPAALSRYTALVIVTRGDAAQESMGLTEAAEACVADWVKAGGRLLCAYGCPPPAVILDGGRNTVSFGVGPDWVVSDDTHPITAGMKPGQLVRYSVYRCRLRPVAVPSRILLAEPNGLPAVLSIPYGAGEVIQTCGDLGHGGRDGTSDELRYRIMLYLLYGRGQERFGSPVPERPATGMSFPHLYTPRALALEHGPRGPNLLPMSAERLPAEVEGYQVRAEAGGDSALVQVRVTTPGGAQAFAPWVRILLGEADVQPGATYQLTAQAGVGELSAEAFAAARLELRFHNAEGVELSHPSICTGDAARSERLSGISTRAVAPEQAVIASVALSAMLPAGQLQVAEVALHRAADPEEVFATEVPLAAMSTSHPRALLSSSEEADLLSRAADARQGAFGVSPMELAQAIRSRADRYLTEQEIRFGASALPWPPTDMPTTGGGLSWNPLAGALAERLKSLALSYRTTGEVRYGERAVELLLALCNWPQWYDPVNNRPSLEIGNIALGACFAHDLCHDLMTAEQRAFAADAIGRNVLMPLYSALSEGPGETNGYALWAAAMGLCGISTLGETPGASSCIRLAEHCLLYYWDRRATDHRTEGQGYDSWAYGLLIFLTDALKRNFDVDHLDHPFLPVIPRFAIAFMANDRYHQAWLADAGGSYQYVPWHFPLALLGNYNRDGNAGWWLRETASLNQSNYDHYKFLAYDPEMPVSEQDPERPGDVFPRAGWASLRSGWERDGTFIALQCSSAAQGHSHMDQNNFLIYCGNQPMAMDCGYASALVGAEREFARGAVGHNCILVDGKPQTRMRGSIPFFSTSATVDYAMGDATAAYSSSLVRRAHRHLVYLKPDLLLVVDDLHAAGGPRSFQWLLHPHSFGELAQVTINGAEMQVGGPPAPGTVELRKGDQQMRVRFLHPAGVETEYVTYPGAERYNPYLQAHTVPAESAVLVTLIEFGDTRADDAEVTLTDDILSFGCSVEGKSYRLSLTLPADVSASPTLEVSVDGRQIFFSDDLRVPAEVTG